MANDLRITFNEVIFNILANFFRLPLNKQNCYVESVWQKKMVSQKRQDNLYLI